MLNHKWNLQTFVSNIFKPFKKKILKELDEWYIILEVIDVIEFEVKTGLIKSIRAYKI